MMEIVVIPDIVPMAEDHKVGLFYPDVNFHARGSHPKEFPRTDTAVHFFTIFAKHLIILQSEMASNWKRVSITALIRASIS